MSTTVDSRVLEMRFDNSHFEKNVSNTMSTLDKLKEKLGFKGATKGLEEVGAATKKVDMNGLGASVESVHAKFSALQVMGVTALANITNSAVNAGKRIIESLTIAPFKEGFSEYEMTLNAIQTTMAGTGKTAKEVEAELKKLDEYADKTVYSTADMLNNLPKFTNAGVELEDATKAMIGIANATAHAGGDAGKASIAFYNLGQAIGTGYLTRMDYNSINNAGIATMKWKEEMVNAAIAAGTLTKTNDGLYKAGKKTFTIQQLFIDGLQEQWATKDVMLKVFGDYGDETTEIGKKAYAAAQDIKTFSMMMDSLKATAGTGWKDTWQIIFGDLDKAKVMWTGLTNFISNIITKMADFRNSILQSALGKGVTEIFGGMNKAMSNVSDMIGKAKEKFEGVSEALSPVKNVIDGITKTLDEHNAVVDEVIQNKWGNAEKRWNALTEAGYDWVYVQNKVNEKLGNSKRRTSEYTEALGKQGDATNATTDAQTKLSKSDGELLASLCALSDEQLLQMGYTKLQIKSLRELQEIADKLGLSIEDLVANMDEIDGRWLFLNSFKNLGNMLTGVGTAIKEAWKDIFPEATMESIANAIFNALAAFHKFTAGLKLMTTVTDENGKEIQVLSENGEKLARTFKGIFAALDIVLTVVGGPLKIVFKILTQILEAFGFNILDVTAFVGDALVKFHDWFDSLFDISGILDMVVPVIKKMAEAIRNAASAIKNSDWFKVASNVVQGLINGLRDGVTKVWNAALEIGRSVLESVCNFLGIESPSKEFMEVGRNIVQGLIEGIKQFDWSKISAVLWSISSFFPNAAIINILAAAANFIGALGEIMLNKIKEILGIHSPSTEFAEVGKNIIDGLILGIKNGASRIWETIKSMFTSIVGWVQQIDFGAIFSAVMGLGILRATNKISDGIAGFGSAMENIGEGLGKLLQNVGLVAKGFSKVLKSIAFENISKAIKNFAISLAILVAALIALAYVCGKDDFNVWEAVGVIGALAIILGILAGAMSLISKSSMDIGKEGIKIGNLTSGLIGIGAALLLVALTVKMIGSMDPETAKAGFEGLGKVILAMVGILVACRLLTTGDSASVIDKTGKTILKISIAMGILVLVAKMIAGMKWEDMFKAAVGLHGLLVMVSLLMLVTNVVGPNADKIGGTILKISIAMGVLVLVAKMIAKMSWEDMGKAAIGLLGLVAIISTLILATKLAGSNPVKIGGTILAIATAIALLAIIIRLIGDIDETSLKKGVAIVTIFGALIVGLIAATRMSGEHAGKAAATILAASAAVGILAMVAVLLGMVKLENLAKGIIAVGLLSAMVALMAYACRGVKDIKGNIIALTVAIGLMAGAIVGLSFIDPVRLATATGALSALMGMFALLIFVMQFLKTGEKTFKRNLTTLGVLTGVVLVLAGVIALLSKCNPNSVLPTTAALSLLLVSLTGSMLILSKVNGKTATNALKGVLALTAMVVPLAVFAAALHFMPDVTAAADNLKTLLPVITFMTALLIPLTLIGALAGFTALIGVLALTAMVVPLAAFVAALHFMPDISGAEANVKLLVKLMTAMTALLIPLTLIGFLSIGAFAGIWALTAMVLPLTVFCVALHLLPDVSGATGTVDLLVSLLNSLTSVLVQLAPMAPLAILGVAALYALTPLIVAFGVLAAAISGLNVLFPDLEMFLATGINILVQLASGLGLVIGSFIASFAGEVMTILPQLGLCLSQFMVNATPFIVGVKMVDESVLTGVGILSAAILALTAANLITGIVEFLPCAGSLASLGSQLSMFMTNAMPFIMGAAMITPEMTAGVKALAETILILTAANVIEGLASFLTGGSSLETFAAQLPILGKGLADFSASLGSFTEEQLATVNCAAQAVKTLASAAAEIPNTGGLLASIVGENDLGTFANQFPILGSGLANFLTNVGTFTEEQVATVNCAASAIKSLAQASSEIPNSGGWLGQIVGENDLGTFAEQFPVLGTGLRGFLDNVGTFTDEQVATVDCAASAIKTLASAASEIPNSGGWVGAIVGENDLGTFADQFPKLGTGLAGFLTNVGTFTDEQVTTVNCAANAVKTLASVASTIPNEGGWLAKIVGDNNLGAFADNFPKLGAGLAGFAEKIGTFTDAQVTTVNAAVRAVKALTGLANADLSGAKKNLSGFSDKLPDFGKKLGDFCSNMPSSESTTSAVSNLNKILGAVKSIASADSGPLATFAKNLGKIGKDAVKKFVEAFTSSSAKTDLKKAAKDLGDQVVDGVEAKEKAIKTAGEDAAKKAVSGVKTQKDEMKSAGKDLGSGLVKGINAKKQAAYDAGYELGQKAVQGEKDGQKSASPSKLTIQAGKWLGEGLIIGMGKMGGQVYKSGRTLGETATDSLSSSIANISKMVSTDIDAQPTIRPVLDLSDVKSGAATLGSMLNMDSSVGVRANIGAISSMMATRGQNGGNADVVAAIDKLNKRMDNLGNTTYQINGVTYDDGSNINDAVATLVRAARIERRV